MATAPDLIEPPARARLSVRERATASAIAIAIELLIVLALLTLGAHVLMPKQQPDLQTFTVAPIPTPKPAQTAQQHKARARHTDAGAVSPTHVHTPVPIPPPPFQLPGVIPLRLADADISKIQGPPKPQASTSDDGDSSQDSAAAYGPGEGPGGQRLYEAEWYRRPSDAELSFYIPKTGAPPGSVALIACRTIANYHVDNCQSLGESPAGSGLARAMRNAAWQFLVRPPRVGGKSMVGAWVRIRIDFTDKPGAENK
jgi:protein TonB